jgi:hypothetical protein
LLRKNATVQFAPLECNPRFTGASYPTLIARKLGAKQWLSEQMSISYHHLEEIDLTGIEYNPETQTGVVFVNWGPVVIGKLSVLIVGSPKQQAELKKELQRRL